MDEQQFPVGEVLRGLEVSALPEAWTPLEAVCMVKCLGEDGSPKWAMRMTGGINEEELLGALAHPYRAAQAGHVERLDRRDGVTPFAGLRAARH